jgi:glc operon protein GlcG
MNRKVFVVLSLGLAAAFSLQPASAQAPQGPGQGQGQGRGQGPGQAQAPRPMGIDVATAKKMVAAAETAAIKANASVAIAVVDVNGDLVYFERMDGASARAVTSSQGKARAALMFGVPTKAVQDAMAAGRPLSATITAPVAGAWEMTPMQGGLPILKDGKVVAAIGAGGSAPANDEAFAQAGLDAISPK